MIDKEGQQQHWFVHHGPLTVRVQGQPDEVHDKALSYLSDNRFFGTDFDPPLDMPVITPVNNQSVLDKTGVNGVPELISTAHTVPYDHTYPGRSKPSELHEQQGRLFRETPIRAGNALISLAYNAGPHFPQPGPTS